MGASRCLLRHEGRSYGTQQARKLSNSFTAEKGSLSEYVLRILLFCLNIILVSFHILLDPHDSPIRIDVPDWGQTFAKTGWPKPIDFNVDDLLKIMVTGYCGLDCHNLWLKNVDERVRLKKRTVDTIYFPLMERQFNAKIIRGRSYRRVRYP